MTYDIFIGIALVLLYVITLYAGCKKAENKSNSDEPYATIWENIERVSLAAFCIGLFMCLLSMKFDLLAYFLREILGKLEALAARG